MHNDTSAEAAAAGALLTAWAAGDFDGFAAALASISEPGEDLANELRNQEGDARGIRGEIEDELDHLASLVRGALYLCRHSLDLALDPPARGRFIGREDVLRHLLEQA